MSDALRSPLEEDTGAVARLTSESWPEPGDASARFDIFEKVVA